MTEILVSLYLFLITIEAQKNSISKIETDVQVFKAEKWDDADTAKTDIIAIHGKIKGMQKSDSISKEFRNKV